MKLKVKVCGMREEENILSLSDVAIDYMGFIFYPISPRHYVHKSISISHLLPKGISAVGVFVDEHMPRMMACLQDIGSTIVQLHGHEDRTLCNRLRDEGLTVIKAFSIGSKKDITQIAEYTGAIDYVLLDTKGQQKGGNGTQFDWSLLLEYEADIPFFLSGGISIDSIEEIHKVDHPLLYAIDINSKFELSAGRKDVDLIQNFIHELSH